MNLPVPLTRLLKAVRPSRRYRHAPASYWPWSWFGRLPGSDYDYERQAGELYLNSAVAACLRVLTTNFVQPDIEVRRLGAGDDDEPIPNHPLTALLDHVNDHHDPAIFWASFATSAVTDGNAFALIVRSRAKVPVELWWVPPWLIDPKRPEDGSTYLSHYEYRVGGETYSVPPADVLHFRYGLTLDPFNDLRALSPLKAGLRSICGLNEVDGAIAAIMRNAGMPTVVISPAKEADYFQKDDVDRLKSQWRENHTGEQRGTPFVPAGPVEVTPVSWPPDKMAFAEIADRLENQICALTGVNAMVASLPTANLANTYANYETARRAFYQDTLMPMQSALARCIGHKLLGQPGMGGPDREYVAFNYEGISGLEEDAAVVWERVGKAYVEHQVIKRSEARQALGMDWDAEDEVYYTDLAAAMKPEAKPTMDGQPMADDEGDEDEDEPASGRKAMEGEQRPPFRVRVQQSNHAE